MCYLIMHSKYFIYLYMLNEYTVKDHSGNKRKELFQRQTQHILFMVIW